MTKISQDISLIITTYNNPAFLELILKSILSSKTYAVRSNYC